jgi:hypothetical protein
MKKVKIFLILFGILLEFLAFSLGYPEKISFAAPIFYPSYIQANNELQHLTSNRNLTYENDDFEIIANIFIYILKQQNSPKIIKNLYVKN